MTTKRITSLILETMTISLSLVLTPVTDFSQGGMFAENRTYPAMSCYAIHGQSCRANALMLSQFSTVPRCEQHLHRKALFVWLHGKPVSDCKDNLSLAEGALLVLSPRNLSRSPLLLIKTQPFLAQCGDGGKFVTNAATSPKSATLCRTISQKTILSVTRSTLPIFGLQDNGVVGFSSACNSLSC